MLAALLLTGQGLKVLSKPTPEPAKVTTLLGDEVVWVKIDGKRVQMTNGEFKVSILIPVLKKSFK